jgi:hypothetical protein
MHQIAIDVAPHAPDGMIDSTSKGQAFAFRMDSQTSFLVPFPRFRYPWGKRMPNETNILPNVSASGLKALANAMLAPKAQSQLDDLLARNSEGKLSEQESKELDSLIEQIDELNLLKARADFTLRHQQDAGES